MYIKVQHVPPIFAFFLSLVVLVKTIGWQFFYQTLNITYSQSWWYFDSRHRHTEYIQNDMWLCQTFLTDENFMLWIKSSILTMIQMDRKESKVNNLVVIFFVFCKFQNENRCASPYLFEPTLQNVVWETICRKLKNQKETCLLYRTYIRDRHIWMFQS